MLRIGVVGYGYWGPNITRNFNGCDGAQVTAVCDQNPASLKKVEKIYPGIKLISDVKEAFAAPDIDALAIVTPVSTHYPLAKAALESGKHVFVEKPFTETVEHAEELIELAARKNLVIMVDHTFIFTGAVRKIKELIDDRALGEIYYYDSTRVNLGLFQHDINVVWDLAPHDFAILNYVLPQKPHSVVACGKTHVNGHEDVAYITINYEGNLIAHVNVNWLSPVKIRTTLIGGESKMLLWNDIDPDEKIRVYDRGVEVKGREHLYDILVSYRTGDVWSPKLAQEEALSRECKYFLECIENDRVPLNDGKAGLDVVKLLVACTKSMRNGGKLVHV